MDGSWNRTKVELEAKIEDLERQRKAAVSELSSIQHQFKSYKRHWSPKFHQAEKTSAEIEGKIRKMSGGNREIVERLKREIKEVRRDVDRKRGERRKLREMWEEVERENTALLLENGSLQAQISLPTSPSLSQSFRQAELLQTENRVLIANLLEQESISSRQQWEIQRLMTEVWENHRLYSAQVSRHVSRTQSPCEDSGEWRAREENQHEDVRFKGGNCGNRREGESRRHRLSSM